jgi:hypothetical protein
MSGISDDKNSAAVLPAHCLECAADMHIGRGDMTG